MIDVGLGVLSLSQTFHQSHTATEEGVVGLQSQVTSSQITIMQKCLNGLRHISVTSGTVDTPLIVFTKKWKFGVTHLKQCTKKKPSPRHFLSRLASFSQLSVWQVYWREDAKSLPGGKSSIGGVEKLGMQNKLIARVIVSFLCITSSSTVGAGSVTSLMVPAAMVNVFLCPTACKFSLLVFSRCLVI
uniref:Secreted protein n=1 Tax=Echinococcus granulosus TaxID=6210 RepID=A0A068WU93_ECHGR|nr:hypothetical protein EgrG_002039800 [Echinococcus granulosus]